MDPEHVDEAEVYVREEGGGHDEKGEGEVENQVEPLLDHRLAESYSQVLVDFFVAFKLSYGK